MGQAVTQLLPRSSRPCEVTLKATLNVPNHHFRGKRIVLGKGFGLTTGGLGLSGFGLHGLGYNQRPEGSVLTVV